VRSRKPLYVIGAAAAVSLWGGWVGLGMDSGFGLVHLFPGVPVLGRIVVNLAITLPVSMEVYGAVALGFALDRTINERARKYAMWTGCASFAVGMAAQAMFHLLTSWHLSAAPWWVVMFVSWVPVLVLGMAAGLYHVAADAKAPAATEAQPEPSRTEDELRHELALTRAVRLELEAARSALASGPPSAGPVDPLADLESRPPEEAAEPVRGTGATPAWREMAPDALARLVLTLSRNELAARLGCGRSTADRLREEHGVGKANGRRLEGVNGANH
jgi:F0F1-type ATP synthase assembly protein I